MKINAKESWWNQSLNLKASLHALTLPIKFKQYLINRNICIKQITWRLECHQQFHFPLVLQQGLVRIQVNWDKSTLFMNCSALIRKKYKNTGIWVKKRQKGLIISYESVILLIFFWKKKNQEQKEMNFKINVRLHCKATEL